jgi:D-alanyl-D-alanine carboxypeptidase
LSISGIAIVLSLTLASPAQAFAKPFVDNQLSLCARLPNAENCELNSPKSIVVVVNKQRPVAAKNFAPNDLVRVPKYNPMGRIVRKEVSKALVRLGNAMKAAGKGTLVVQDGFRGYSVQRKVHAAKVRSLGKTKGEALAARAGHSEHQLGLAVDLAAQGVSTAKISFGKTKAGIWLAENSYRYGFIVRYPKGKTEITGYRYEPWHFRYVGVDVATRMHETGITTLEEFFGLPAAPTY